MTPEETDAELVKATSDCLTQMDDILHNIQNKVQYLSQIDSNQYLKATPGRVAYEMNKIDTMLDKARVLLFQAHKSPVLLACITELLNQERAWSGGGCDHHLTRSVMAAVVRNDNPPRQ